jgi:hypothetical protein
VLVITDVAIRGGHDRQKVLAYARQVEEVRFRALSLSCMIFDPVFIHFFVHCRGLVFRFLSRAPNM